MKRDPIHITLMGMGFSDSVSHKLWSVMELHASGDTAGFRYKQPLNEEWHEVTFTDADLVERAREIMENMLLLETTP